MTTKNSVLLVLYAFPVISVVECLIRSGIVGWMPAHSIALGVSICIVAATYTLQTIWRKRA